MDTLKADLLIVGMGAAGQLAALYAHDADPDLKIVIATKALRGKGGCSRMVQGGFNVVLNSADSAEKHFMDTLKGGQYVNDQELVRTLVEEATPTIKEMENRFGCFFDRNPDGTIHQKPFAGQSFDRTVHKGDLTGIEIISRFTEQVARRSIPVMEDCRALDLLVDASGRVVTGALLLDMRRGEFITVEASATLVATGGGPTNYRFHAPGPEKSLDGLGMLYRSGVRMRDMEMVQFHPTGLIVPGSVVAGSLLEEGLRGAGAQLFNGEGERFMLRYAPNVAERATRDVVSRCIYLEMMNGRACREGGVHIHAAHLGAEFVEKNFPGMCERCRQFHYDLARGPVPVSPSAHYMMGGAVIDRDCRTSLERLFVAGEDSGGVHGGNRLGGNGICDSCVYGRQAGRALAAFLHKERGRHPETRHDMVRSLVERYSAPFERTSGRSPFELRDRLREANWNLVGVVRTEEGLSQAVDTIEEIAEGARGARLSGAKAHHMPWNYLIDLLNMIDVSRITAMSARMRKESRAAHYRSDYPEQDDRNSLYNIIVKRGEQGTPVFETQPVEFRYKGLEECQKYRK
jgi:succinate dehydrogenase / fumarate reductase flavoprotein subunit/fumarate reductase flavoprotein subunit